MTGNTIIVLEMITIIAISTCMYVSYIACMCHTLSYLDAPGGTLDWCIFPELNWGISRPSLCCREGLGKNQAGPLTSRDRRVRRSLKSLGELTESLSVAKWITMNTVDGI